MRGQRVEVAPWNGPFEPFAAAAIIVIRATWDYHQAPEAYLEWLERLDPARTYNRPSLVRWNLSKAHVLELGALGVPVPRSLEIAAQPTELADALKQLELREAVIKPLIGASGAGVERVVRGDEAAALARSLAAKKTSRLLVQELLPGIEHGELAGVFFDGRFSHGLRRVPAPGEFRVNSQYGGRMDAADIPPAIVRDMAAVLALLPDQPLYARIDGLVCEGQLTLIEVEVNEPGLGLDVVDGAADRFAEAILRR